jgi:hypothetical protein
MDQYTEMFIGVCPVCSRITSRTPREAIAREALRQHLRDAHGIHDPTMLRVETEKGTT